MNILLISNEVAALRPVIFESIEIEENVRLKQLGGPFFLKQNPFFVLTFHLSKAHEITNSSLVIFFHKNYLTVKSSFVITECQGFHLL